MKKIWSLWVALALVFVLAACGTAGEEGEEANEENGATEEGNEEEATEEATPLTVGASNVPHAEILEFASDLLAEEGIELHIETFNDYVLPNEALEAGELDANYFQHIPYLEQQIEDHEYDFENVGGVHIEPIGVYSQKYDHLDDLEEGAEVIMSDSVTDHGRILKMLEEEGLITLAEGAGVEATIDDIEENPKNLEFRDNVEAALLPQAYEQGEGDIVLINSNFALDHGLNPAEDAISIESAEDNPYVNIIAVRSEDAENEDIQTLVDVLQSEEVRSFIEEEYSGAVIPAEE